jgi:hypothetical protein
MNGMPSVSRVALQELSPTERDRLLARLLQKIGYEIEATKWDGEHEREIDLVRPLTRSEEECSTSSK